MSVRRNVLLGLFAAGAATLAVVGGGVPTGSGEAETFEYEGRLLENGLPVNAVVDLEFGVFDAGIGGAQVGPTLFAEEVPVEDGYFFVTLEFGEFEYNASRHWLEMSVDGLTLPRQRLVRTFDLDQAATGMETPGEADEIVQGKTKDGASGKFGRASGGAKFDPGSPGSWDLAGVEGDPDGDPENPFSADKNEEPGGFEDATGIWNTRGNEYYYKRANVGVGTSNPAYPLDVRNNSRSRTLNVDNSDNAGTRYGIYARAKSTGGRGIFGYASSSTGNTYGVWGRANSPDGTAVHGAATAATGPNLGVFGRSSSDAGTGVYGLASAATGVNYGVYGESMSSSGFAAYFAGAKSYFEGRVGIGADPSFSHKLQVEDTSASNNVVHIDRIADGIGFQDVLEIEMDTGSSADAQYIECQAGDVDFRVDRDGDVYCDGSFTGGGADFAEMMRVSTGADSVGPGDVLVIDPESARSVVASARARSTLVAGVYSTSPGLIGSEHDWDLVTEATFGPTIEGEEPITMKTVELGRLISEIPLAVVGIVPVKVSTENGAIRIGDLLVTSNTPGHAMRDTNPQTGTVLGKALEELNNGTGTIRVLVTLQ